MNFALMVSNKVEEKLALVERSEDWTISLEAQEYQRCFAEALHDLEGRAWAGGDIRVGDYILLGEWTFNSTRLM